MVIVTRTLFRRKIASAAAMHAHLVVYKISTMGKTFFIFFHNYITVVFVYHTYDNKNVCKAGICAKNFVAVEGFHPP